MQAIRQGKRVSTATFIVMLLLFFALVYIYFYRVREFYNNHQFPSDHCLSELASVKYQLDNVSEYKKKMDTLLIELQQECNVHKSDLREFVDHYKEMKNHLQTCEMQTEELEVECKQLKQNLTTVALELETCKKPPG